MDASELAWLAQIGQAGESAGTRTEPIATPRRHSALRYETVAALAPSCKAADGRGHVLPLMIQPLWPPTWYARHTTPVLGSSVLRPAGISGPFQRHPGHERRSVLVEGQDLDLLNVCASSVLGVPSRSLSLRYRTCMHLQHYWAMFGTDVRAVLLHWQYCACTGGLCDSR